MNYTKKIEDLTNYEQFITNKKDYIQYNGIVIYKGEYISTEDIERIKNNTSHNIENILKDFTIPTTYMEDESGKTLDISPLLMENLIQNIEEIEEEKEWQSNFISVRSNHNKERIFEFLIDLYENFISIYIKDNDDKIIATIHQLYTNIENILNNPEIGNQMENYKIQKNLKNRLNKDNNKIKNPIIKIQLEQIMLYINEFTCCLDINIQSEIFKNIEWKGRKTIIKESKKYLYSKYHTKELNYLLYQDYLKEFDLSIDQLYHSLEEGKQEVEEGEELPKANYYIEKLRSDILQYIEGIQPESINDDDINTILEEINERVFDRFLRDYYDLEDDDDTGSESRFLANDFSNINHCIEILIRDKEYQYIEALEGSTKPTVIPSTSDLFRQINKYNKARDNEKFINSLHAIKEHKDSDINNMLSQNELQILLDIVVEEGIYEFAARIRDIIAKTY